MDKEFEENFMRQSMASGIYRPKQESPCLRSSSPTSHRQLISELEEQLALSKRENKRKEEMIRKLSCIEVQPVCPAPKFDYSKLDSVLSSDRVALDHARQELSSVQMKLEALNQQLHEARHKAESRESEANRYRLELEAFCETESRQATVIEALKQKLLDTEAQYCQMESTSTRSRVVIEQLQQENCEVKGRIVELENRLKALLMDRENAEQNVANAEKRYSDLVCQLRSLFHFEQPDIALECIFNRISDCLQSCSMEKTKSCRLQEEIECLKVEDKANRETIQRLVAEVAREQKATLRCSSDIEKLRCERDEALNARIDVERETEIFRCKIEQLQRQCDSSRCELESYMEKYQKLERDTRESCYEARNCNTQYNAFREQLASLLGDGYTLVQPMDDEIKKHIEYLKEANKDKDTHICLLKEKLENIRVQFEEQYKMQKVSHDRNSTFESENSELKEHIRRLECDVAANEAMRDGLRGDREKYLRFLEQISSILKMDRVSADTGLDCAIDTIVVRCEQLVKLENEAVRERTTHIYSLQRKIKSMKEQLESKDLHLDLLRKKVTQLEERINGCVDLDRERECQSQKAGSLEKLVERYRCQLEAARGEIQNLKAQLLGSSEIRCENMQANQTLGTLEVQLREMRECNEQQAKKIVSLKRELQSRGGECDDRISRQDNIVRQLTDENRHLKVSVQEVRDREQELLDQRQVIARMLGLDACNLAIPAFEIIERLRRLIEANHASCLVVASSNDNLLESMDDAYRAGYENAEVEICNRSCPPKTKVVCRRSSPPPMHEHSRTRRVIRARSVSPVRRVDPRAY